MIMLWKLSVSMNAADIFGISIGESKKIFRFSLERFGWCKLEMLLNKWLLRHFLRAVKNQERKVGKKVPIEFKKCLAMHSDPISSIIRFELKMFQNEFLWNFAIMKMVPSAVTRNLSISLLGSIRRFLNESSSDRIEWISMEFSMQMFSNRRDCKRMFESWDLRLLSKTLRTISSRPSKSIRLGLSQVLCRRMHEYSMRFSSEEVVKTFIVASIKSSSFRNISLHSMTLVMNSTSSLRVNRLVIESSVLQSFTIES